MNSESLKNSPIRRLFKASTVVALAMAFSAAAHADLGARISGDEARGMYNGLDVQEDIVSQSADAATTVKMGGAVSCFREVNLADEKGDVVSYECFVLSTADLEK